MKAVDNKKIAAGNLRELALGERAVAGLGVLGLVSGMAIVVWRAALPRVERASRPATLREQGLL